MHQVKFTLLLLVMFRMSLSLLTSTGIMISFNCINSSQEKAIKQFPPWKRHGPVVGSLVDLQCNMLLQIFTKQNTEAVALNRAAFQKDRAKMEMWSFVCVALWTFPPACSQQSIQTSYFKDKLIQGKGTIIWSEQHHTRKCQCWKGLCTELYHFVKKETGSTETHDLSKITLHRRKK